MQSLPSSDGKLLFLGSPLDQIAVEPLFNDLKMNPFHDTSILRLNSGDFKTFKHIINTYRLDKTSQKAMSLHQDLDLFKHCVYWVMFGNKYGAESVLGIL